MKAKVKKKAAKPLSRKELRKQKVQEKKETKRLYFSSKKEGLKLVAAAAAEKAAAKLRPNPKKKSKKKKPKNKVSNPEDIPVEELLSGRINSDDDESIDSDFSDNEIDALLPAKKPKTEVQQKKAKTIANARPDVADVHRKEKQKQKDLENQARKQRRKQLLRENEEEDKLIATLEKKLKLNKTKDKNRLVRKMFNDGLDYALEFCLDDEEEKKKLELKEKRKEERRRAAEAEENGWDEDDLEEDYRDETKGRNDLDDSEDDLENMLQGDDSDDDNDIGGSMGENSDEEAEVDNSDLGSDEEDSSNKKEEYKEDIYGRKRDKDGNIIKESVENLESNPSQKYVPPHQRALLAAKADDKQVQLMERLKKNCKGLLNRLSEANLHKISTGIEDLYMRNSRFHMNETLSTLLKEALIMNTIANERMVQEHMVLLAYLHAQIGNEIGAHFLQLFIELFNDYMKEVETIPTEDKKLNNLILVLSYIYLFRIYEHRLLLQIIDKMTEKLCEKTIECLLLVFQSVGFKLRKDDPMAFKQMLMKTQQRIAEAPLELKENLRLKFMVETLNAVKNNNISKIPQFDPELGETLRKRLKAMLRNDKYVVTLSITLEDLLRVDSVGKWWVVGSAWTGNVNDLGSAANAKQEQSNHSSNLYSEKILKLAKKYKMNTEERRNIFCIIMMADDYADAFQKIMHLNLKDQRNIAYVTLYCALLEKQSNPYYAHLALKFCNSDRKFQLAFQFAAWDRINEMDSLLKPQINNLAQFLKYLIINGGLQLSVLKVVDFLQLNKLSFYFMREAMKSILLHPNEREVYQVFERIAKNEKLHQFKQSIQLFMQHFLLKEEGVTKLKLSDEQLELLRKRVDYAYKLLAYVDL